MKPASKFLCFLSISIFMWTCGGSPLSSGLKRSKAREIIEASKDFNESAQAGTLSLDEKDVQRGVKVGYWRVKDTAFLGNVLELTALGHRFFTGFDPQVMGIRNAHLATPPKPSLTEVTGITDAPASDGPVGTAKIVDFTVKLSLGKALDAVFEVRPIKMKALLKLYDDGWRVERLGSL